MMKSRRFLLLLTLSAAMLVPGMAMAVDDPAITPAIPDQVDPATVAPTDPSTETAPITIDPNALEALDQQAAESDENKSAFEKASDFVTDNAPWFIIGIIVLAAIVAGILIMRGRPGRGKSARAATAAGATGKDLPAQVPSASELRRRKRAAIQRSREEERLRRKAGIEGRKSARPGAVPPAQVSPAAAGVAAAGAAAAVGAAGGLDPVEAEKQGARDQETAAAAMARFGPAPVQAGPPQPGAIPAPIAPSQTAPAAGVVTPDAAFAADTGQPTAPPAAEPVAGFDPEPDTNFEQAPASPAPAPDVYVPEAETSILREPALEAPGPDAAVGNAAEAFLAGSAAGAAGGLAAARASRSGRPEPDPAEPLEPVIAPEPGMAPEHALADLDPVAPAPEPTAPASADDAAAAAAGDRLRAKVAEMKATQQPAIPEPVAEPAVEPASGPAPLGPDAELSPGLAAVERKLSENSEERDRALRDAEERLRRVEQRAEDAERRAAFAERLAQLKVEESERERRLNDVVSGIDRAEQRARDAEARAESAERAAAAALGQSDLKAPEPPAPAFSASVPEPAAPAEPPAATTAPPADPPAPLPPAPPAAEPPAPARKGLFGNSSSTRAAADPDSVNLNSATFEELREAGLSVTQATRILAYRERFGGYSSVEDLEKVPGFPSDLIESLRHRLSI